jgi:hypothetical protein
MSGANWYFTGEAASAGQSFTGSVIDLWLAQNRYQLAGMSETLDVATDFSRSTVADWFAPDGVSLAAQAAIDVLRRDGRGATIEPARTAWGNADLAGAAAGSPGTLPTGWGTFSPTGLTRTIVLETVGGVPTILIRWQGTATSTAPFYVATTASGTIAASMGQWWTSQSLLQVTRDDVAVTAISQAIQERDGTGAYLTGGGDNYHSTRLAWSRRVTARTLTDAATASVIHTVVTTNDVASGTTVDFEIRIGLPNIAQGALSNPVRGNDAATTRAADLLTIPTWPAPSAVGTAVMVTGTISPVATCRLMEVNNADNSQHLAFYLTATNTIEVANISGGGTRSLTGTNLPLTGRNVVALRWGSGSVAASINGALPVSGALTLPAGPYTRAVIGASSDNSLHLNGAIERFIHFPTARSDADMQILSAPATWGIS